MSRDTSDYDAKRSLDYGQAVAVRVEGNKMIFALLHSDGEPLAEIAADPYIWEDLLEEGWKAYHAHTY